jgi:serine/threonine-protein kinase
VDRRTDVFALGIILYQLTTGKHPFRGESDLVTLQNIVSDKPIVSPRAYDKQYPRKLENVVMRALDRRRESRFQTCAELEAALDDVFDKELPRTRTEDVGRFVTEMLGARGEQRRRALVDSIRLADERAGGAIIPLGPPRGSMPASMPTPPSGQILSLGPRKVQTDTDPNSVRATPPTTVAPTSSRRGRASIVVAALVAAAAIGAVAALRQGPAPTDEAVTAGAASRPPPARVQKPEEPSVLPPVEAPEPAPSAAEEAPVPDEPRAKPAGKHSKGKARAVGTETATPPASKPAGIASPAPVGPRAAAPKSPASGGASKSGFVPPPVSDPGF